MIKAGDIMSEDIIVIYETMLLRQAAHLMLRDRVSAFPVVNKNTGLVGVITITDLFRILGDSFRSAGGTGFEAALNTVKDRPVGEVMTTEVTTITRETALGEIVAMVMDRGIHTFPVVEDGRLVGIVSRHDILNATFTYD